VKENEVLGLTFFITTGTFRAQGIMYKHSAEKNFPILKQILDKMLELPQAAATTDNDEEESESHMDSTSCPVSSANDTEETLVKKSAQSNTSNVLKFEKGITDAINKLELSQGKDMECLVKLTSENNENCAKKLNRCLVQLEQINSICTSLTTFKDDVMMRLERIEKQEKLPLPDDILKALERIEEHVKPPLTNDVMRALDRIEKQIQP
jgi:hypothetical protein